MALIIYNKNINKYLMSPEVCTLRGKPDALWLWSASRLEAHQFADRASAKAVLRSIVPDHINLLKDCTFFKV